MKPPERPQINVRVPTKAELSSFKKAAKAEGATLTDLILEYLRRLVKRHA